METIMARQPNAGTTPIDDFADKFKYLCQTKGITPTLFMKQHFDKGLNHLQTSWGAGATGSRETASIPVDALKKICEQFTITEDLLKTPWGDHGREFIEAYKAADNSHVSFNGLAWSAQETDRTNLVSAAIGIEISRPPHLATRGSGDETDLKNMVRAYSGDELRCLVNGPAHWGVYLFEFEETEWRFNPPMAEAASAVNRDGEYHYPNSGSSPRTHKTRNCEAALWQMSPRCLAYKNTTTRTSPKTVDRPQPRR